MNNLNNLNFGQDNFYDHLHLQVKQISQFEVMINGDAWCWLAQYIIWANHNYVIVYIVNKILKSDWRSTPLISALIGLVQAN